MEINIGITSEQESNEFLRCLWAEMGKEFGKCGWNYAPNKKLIKNRIFFGFMDIGVSTDIAVSITYKERGTIKNIYFELPDKFDAIPKSMEFHHRIKAVVNNAKRNIGQYSSFQFAPIICLTLPLATYEGRYFKTEIVDDFYTRFRFEVKGYDRNQVGGNAVKKIIQVMEFLSVETNIPIWKEKYSENHGSLLKTEIFQEDNDFIDGYSIVDKKYIVLSMEGKLMLDKILSPDERDDENLELFLKACHHFYTARMYDAGLSENYSDDLLVIDDKTDYPLQSLDIELAISRRRGNSDTEIATTLYLSALEVLTLIDFKGENCSCCGQPKYQISKRVRSLVGHYLNDDVAKSLNDYYDKRSKYLHTGMKLTIDEPTTSIIPLLDMNEKSGCKIPIQVSLPNLREYVSYCMRKFYKENLI
ncbi:hypothetical protein QNH39_18805 [Neobacillus novalis]|uniref:Apea-like HEPN domain-containing protein n=1 Tax=Neobacillus novalis TaxID=220687 RepID=A0AA95SEV5_9BACI|nr:hypothetical protein [Neobacillus novalis]WHY84686.1 hypothetical protein QNH39_18805 [Neobacillus novalis]